MSEEKHHHLFHHHKKDEEQPTGEYGYSETVATEVVTTGEDEYERYKKEEKEHKHKQHLGEAGAIAAGAFALYEKHEAKKDPEHAHRHKITEEVAAVAAVGAGGYAFHEHHEKKDHKDAEQGQRREEAPPPLRLTVPYWPAIELCPARPAQRAPRPGTTTTPPTVLWRRMDCNRNFDALQPFQNHHCTRPPRQLIITPSFHPHTEPAATSSLVEAIPIGPAGNPQIPSQIGGLSSRHAAIFLESAPCIRSGSGENGQSCNQIDLEIEGITVYCPHLGALQTTVIFPNRGAAEIGEGDAAIQSGGMVVNFRGLADGICI